MSPTQGAILKRVSGWLTAWAVNLILVGLLAIALPLEMPYREVMIVGWLMILSGGIQGLYTFQSKGFGKTVWDSLVALLYVCVGIYFVTHPDKGLRSLAAVIAFLFFTEGFMDVSAYLQDRTFGGAAWIACGGIVKIILGIVIWGHLLSDSTGTIGTLIAISMVITGLARLMVTLAVRGRFATQA